MRQIWGLLAALLLLGCAARPAAELAAPRTILYANGYVYHDTDNDGQRDIAEAGLAGATLRVQTGASATSSISGWYELQLAPGAYTLTVTLPAGWQVAVPTALFTLADGNVLINFGAQPVSTPSVSATLSATATSSSTVTSASESLHTERWTAQVIPDAPDCLRLCDAWAHCWRLCLNSAPAWYKE